MRVRRRDRYLHKPNANLNGVSVQNDEIILRDTFKYALKVISYLMPGFYFNKKYIKITKLSFIFNLLQ